MNEEQRERNDKSSQRPKPLRWCAYCWAYTPHIWRGRVYECVNCRGEERGTDMSQDALDIIHNILGIIENSSDPPRSESAPRKGTARILIGEIRRRCDYAEEVLDGDKDTEEQRHVDVDLDGAGPPLVPGTGLNADPYFPDDPDDYQFENICE